MNEKARGRFADLIPVIREVIGTDDTDYLAKLEQHVALVAAAKAVLNVWEVDEWELAEKVKALREVMEKNNGVS